VREAEEGKRGGREEEERRKRGGREEEEKRKRGGKEDEDRRRERRRRKGNIIVLGAAKLPLRRRHFVTLENAPDCSSESRSCNSVHVWPTCRRFATNKIEKNSGHLPSADPALMKYSNLL
jgi:hypothetical protein